MTHKDLPVLQWRCVYPSERQCVTHWRGCCSFSRGLAEGGDHEESEDSRERRAARRAQLREQRAMEEEANGHTGRASKRPRREATAGATSDSDGSSADEYEGDEVLPLSEAAA
jgi:hypothetical protein